MVSFFSGSKGVPVGGAALLHPSKKEIYSSLFLITTNRTPAATTTRAPSPNSHADDPPCSGAGVVPPGAAVGAGAPSADRLYIMMSRDLVHPIDLGHTSA